MSTHRFENDIEERLRADAERMRHLAESLPAACVEQSRERLRNAVQACESRPPLPNRLWDGLTRLHPATLGGLAAAIAALALGAVCLCESLRRQPPPPTPSGAAEYAVAAVVAADPTLLAPGTATTVAAPTAVVPETSVAKAPDQSPGESLAALRAEFERLKASASGVGNGRDYEGSVRVLQEALAEALPPREEAETRFVLGCRYYFRGPASHPAAMQEFRRVLDLKTAHLSDAERMLARIRSTAVAEGFGDILLN